MNKMKYSKLALILALVSVLLIGTTLALQTSGKKVLTNTLTIGTNDTEIVEPTPIPHPSRLNKEVSVENKGTTSAYVRVALTVDVTEGVLSPDQVKFVESVPNPIAEDAIYVVLDNTKAWTQKQDDGYYYFQDILAPEATTAKLVKQVIVGSNVSQAFDVVVYQESAPAFVDEFVLENAIKAFNPTDTPAAGA